MRGINTVEWREFIANDENAVIIDARRSDEWKHGIMENAVMMNVLDQEVFNKKAQTLEKEKNYFVYCKSGIRSAAACKLLEANGIKNTYNLLGGILAWDGLTIIPKQ